ncbi:MAG: metal ABC transporter permease [Pseudolabrys sp.]|nr:metal ABC transporter permease [Pseudolabrys sp.]
MHEHVHAHVHELSELWTDAALRQSLAAVLILALSAAPVGVFLMLRRMSLVGDAMSHAILPGAAVGYLVSGLNVFAMTLGGLVAGLVIAVLAGLVARATEVKEDASLAVFLLASLALGVVIVTTHGMDAEELMHFLFGETAASIDHNKLIIIAVNATVSIVALALIYRPLVLDCVDPNFLRSVSRAGAAAHLTFLVLLVINLVSGFHALGTLLGVGIMIIPAVIARFWTRDITVMIVIAVVAAALSGIAGVLLSHAGGVPAGAGVILAAAVLYAISIVAGPVGGLIWRAVPRRHLEA